MKKVFFLSATLILGFLAFQNAYSKGFKDLKEIDPDSRRLVLWRIYIQPQDSNYIINKKTYYRSYTTIKIDSVLKENFHTDKKFHLSIEKDISKLNPNSYYLALAIAGCSEREAEIGGCFLMFPAENCLEGKSCILPDTPENREYLIKRWNEEKVPYEPFIKYPKVKGERLIRL